ncbi:MAG: hypothetical protein JXR77_02470 [Lentisphaeria bacterium]|nr:hypothetical protein [Lentisphaeria bacterium]
MARTTFQRACRGRAFAAILATVFLLPGWLRGVTEGTEVSQQRVALLRRLAEDGLTQHGLDAPGFALARTVVTEFFKVVPDCPSAMALAEPVQEEECRRAARVIAEELVRTKFPDLDPEVLAAEAAERFPYYEEGDIVEVPYQINPVRRETVKGPYRGRTPNAVQIGRWTIMVADIERVPDSADLLLRLDAERCKELRRAYMEEKQTAHSDARETYRQTVRAVARREQYRMGAQRNEERGYVFYTGSWLPVRDAAARIVEDERARMQKEAKDREAAQVEAKKTAAEELLVAHAAARQLSPHSLYVDPEAEYAALMARVEAEKARRAAEASAKAEGEEGTSGTSAEETAGTPFDSTPDAASSTGGPSASPAASPTVGEEIRVGFPVWLIVVAILFAVGCVVAIVLSIKRSRRPPAKDFFEAKGRVEKNFWGMADADPEHFKYVAYRYPTEEDAKAALLQLSYIHEGPNKQLKCLRSIEFGIYPHQEKYVVFVGGRDLHYALWREASAVFPELPDAEYFRVSAAPEVNLEIPDIEQLLRDSAMKIEHVENREGEGDDFNQYYTYRAPDKSSALEFLRRVNVSEANVHVVVQTPEGVWGKDENGIYQE